MPSCNTKNRPEKAQKYLAQSDELYQVNSVAYIEADLKINHLRILIAIIQHLQESIRHRVNNSGKASDASYSQLHRVLEIPVADFAFGPSNGMRLRSCLEELRRIRVTFPTISMYLLDTFPGLIERYEYPSYGKTVKIYLPEKLTGRLLLIEEGYGHFSRTGALSMTNKYTVRIYWLVCSWRNRGGFVITTSNLKRILGLSKGYDKFGNIISRVLEPSKAELESRFPIWFQYRVYNEGQERRIAFKIHVAISEDERRRIRTEAGEVVSHMLSKAGINPVTVGDLLSRVDAEDIKPFVNKISDLVLYLGDHPYVHDRAAYLRSALQSWFEDWSQRYVEQ